MEFPRVAFTEDLDKEIESRKEKVDHIILMGDINEYILSHNIIIFMANLRLLETINNKYGGQGTGTTRSNKKGRAIDGIWASKGIIISQGGYLPFHNGPKSDHRLLWINISHEIAFRENKAPYRAP